MGDVMARIARVLRFAAVLGLAGYGLTTAALAGTLTATMLGGPRIAATPGSVGSADTMASGSSALRVIGGAGNAAAIPISGAAGIAPTGVAAFNAPASNGNVNAGSDASRGPDQKWGDPLSAGLYDSDSVHAGLNYYYSSGRDGSEGAVGFSVTFH